MIHEGLLNIRLRQTLLVKGKVKQVLKFLILIQAAYTYDAGPNACLYLLEKDVPVVLAAINAFFPTDKKDEEYYRGLNVDLTNVPEVS